MNDISKAERAIPQSEVKKAEALLTPEQRAMSKIRANILAPLEQLDLPGDQVKIVTDYAEKAAESTRREFERLQKESPANTICRCLEARIAGFPREDQRRELQERALSRLRGRVATWQIRINEAQGLAMAQGRKYTRTEAIEDLIEVRRRSGIVGSGVDPEALSIASSTVGGREEIEDILKELGFFSEDTTFNSFFSNLPIKPPQQLTDSQIEKLKWQGKPHHVRKMEGRDIVVGLTSEKLPGVGVVLEKLKADEMAVFCFDTKAIAESTNDTTSQRS